MAPAVILGNISDFHTKASSTVYNTNGLGNQRTLLLAPPSISAHPELLERVVDNHNRDTTDIQMLDRLAFGLINLPASTYDLVLLLTDADGTRSESQNILGRDVISKIVSAMKNGGCLKSQDGQFGLLDGPEKTEAILAGLVSEQDGMYKPDVTQGSSVPIRVGKRKTIGVVEGPTSVEPQQLNGKRKSVHEESIVPTGVGFVDLDALIAEDDQLVDEEDLITEEDLARPVVQREC
jgi:anamorsin